MHTHNGRSVFVSRGVQLMRPSPIEVARAFQGMPRGFRQSELAKLESGQVFSEQDRDILEKYIKEEDEQGLAFNVANLPHGSRSGELLCSV